MKKKCHSKKTYSMPKLRKTYYDEDLHKSFQLYAQISNADISTLKLPKLSRLELSQNQQTSSFSNSNLKNNTTIKNEELRFQWKKTMKQSDFNLNFFENVLTKKKNSLMERNPIFQKGNDEIGLHEFAIAIKPKYMKEQGTMCITDLWSESFKRELKLSAEWQNYVEQLKSIAQKQPNSKQSVCPDNIEEPDSQERINISSNSNIPNFKKQTVKEEFNLPHLEDLQIDNSNLLTNFTDQRFQTEPSLTSSKFKFGPKKVQFQQLQNLCEEFIRHNHNLKKTISLNQLTMNQNLNKWKLKL